MAKMWYEEWPSEDFFDSQEEIDPAEDISETEKLGNAISQERRGEFERSLVQDEHPRDYNAELEDEVEEAVPTSDKRLKREIKAEALRRLEVEDFPVTVIIDSLGNNLYETGRRAYLEQYDGKQQH